MAYYTYTKDPIGVFVEKEHGNHFEYSHNEDHANGFNEDFEGWGREDSEFFVRLMNYGIKRKTLRFNSIQFHLWHKINSRKALLKNDQLLKETINEKLIWCEQGIAQFLKNEKK